MAKADRTKWKKDEELTTVKEKPKTTVELNAVAKQVRDAIRTLNSILEEASHYGMEVIIQHGIKANEKAKVTYDEYEVKKVYKKENF